MTSQLKIYIDRLFDGKKEKLQECLKPHFININETDLKFSSPIHVQGEAYIAEKHLIIQLKIETEALIPCSICNKLVKVPLQIGRFYHTEELSSIKNQVYDYTPLLREEILLEVPIYVECEKNCPERAKIKKYLLDENKQFPFANLKIGR